MSLIFTTIQKEKQRINFMLTEYYKRLEELPKGTITQKKSGNNIYYYLKYRDGYKVVSQYVPEEDVNNMKEKINERIHIKKMIKELENELSVANKALGEKNDFISRK